MPNLKLARLPDRVPVKLTLQVPPDLHQTLTDYVVMYTEAYGEQVRIEDLVPAMLDSFLESDRGFAASRAQRARAAMPR